MNEVKGKQYMPFDALEGYRGEIAKRNIIYIEKPILSDDQLEELSYKLSLYNIHNIISFKYYKKGSILHLTGEIKKIDMINRILVVNNQNIKLNDILEIY